MHSWYTPTATPYKTASWFRSGLQPPSIQQLCQTSQTPNSFSILQQMVCYVSIGLKKKRYCCQLWITRDPKVSCDAQNQIPQSDSIPKRISDYVSWHTECCSKHPKCTLSLFLYLQLRHGTFKSPMDSRLLQCYIIHHCSDAKRNKIEPSS